jgi:hypothetical protein
MLRAVNGLLVAPSPANGAKAALYEVGTSTPIYDTIYADDSSGALLGNPLIPGTDGTINFWLAEERELDVQVTAPGYATVRTTVTTDGVTQAGPAGPPGPPGSPGPVVNWRGAWSSSATYAINDAVSSAGSSYLAIGASSNSPPPSAAWTLMAQVGATGPPGAASTVPGPPGQGVPAGGAAAQVLTKNTATDYDTSWQTPSGGALSWPLLAPNGTVTAPSYSFATDATTGIYMPGTGQIGFAVGGAQFMRLQNYIGIVLEQSVGVNASPNSSADLIVGGSTLTGAIQTGISELATFTSTATTQGIGVKVQFVTQAATFTMASGYGIQMALPSFGAGSAVTTLYGLNVANQGAAAVTNAYGVYIAAQSGAATTNIGLYNAGTTQFQGNVGINHAPDTAGNVFWCQGAAVFGTVVGIDTVPSGSGAALQVNGNISTNLITVSNGTAAAPSIAFSNSTNTGLFLSSAGVLGVTASGASIATFQNATPTFSTNSAQFNGIVGIGVAPSTAAGLVIGGTSYAGTIQYGISAGPGFNSAATSWGIVYSAQIVTQAITFTMTNAVACFVQVPSYGAGSTVSNTNGVYVSNLGASNVTNAYGVYIANQTGAAGNNIALYNAGTSVQLGFADYGSTVRITNAASTGKPTTGAGLELYYDGTQCVVQGYNRNASAYLPNVMTGAPVRFQPFNPSNQSQVGGWVNVGDTNQGIIDVSNAVPNGGMPLAVGQVWQPFGNNNNFTGLIIVCETIVIGGCALFLASGGQIVMVSVVPATFTAYYSITPNTAGHINVYINASNAVEVQNNFTSAGHFQVMGLRTRASQ